MIMAHRSASEFAILVVSRNPCPANPRLVGLASVIIGQVIFGRRSVTLGVLSAVAGSVLYRLILQVAYKADLPSYSVKLLSAIIVVLALSVPVVSEKIAAARLYRADRAADMEAEK